jgi:hypothetical protein
MGTTTNNGWTYPESTDLVKDGATAIETLATDIDTTLGVYSPATPGLSLISTTSFSAVASQSINDVFSATYDNYMIQLYLKNTVSQSYTALRYRVSATDDSNAVYDGRVTYMATSSIGITDQPNGTSQRISYGDNNGNYHSIFVGQPFKTDKTYIKVASSNNDGASGMYAEDYTGVFQNATSFTGFTLIPAANNITGSVSVYGIAK